MKKDLEKTRSVLFRKKINSDFHVKTLHQNVMKKLIFSFKSINWTKLKEFLNSYEKTKVQKKEKT